jgi:PAS domain S-box-containing protein
MDEPTSQDANVSDGSPAPAPNTLSFDPRDLIPTPIFCASPEGRLVWMNAAAEALTGRAASTIAGEPFSILFPEENRIRIARQFLRQRRQGAREFYVEAPLATGTADAHWVGMNVRLATAGKGRSAYLCSAHDLQTVHLELDELRRKARELAARLEEATAGAELKSDFLAAMSQELRAPMNGVIGMSRLLLDSDLDRDQRTFAEVIMGSGEQLLELVDDILDYSSIESGQMEIGRMDFDVRVTVDAVAALLAAGAYDKSMPFSSWVHHRVPSRLNGDPGRLRQVLLNLAKTALRTGEGGELQLRVELVEETAHQAVLRVWVNRLWNDSVLDPRVGSAFDAFGMGEHEALAAGGGSVALGLGISRKIVRLMGGDTGVQAVEGLGSRLWFRVPFGKQAEVSAPAPTALPEVGLSGIRVLVADASDSARRALSQTLSDWGSVCDEAAGGLDALERLTKASASGRAYALAIVDLDLPELDAHALAQAIREDKSLAATGLVLLTTVGRPGDAARAAEWGYDAYFASPVVHTQLKEALIEVLRRHKNTGAADAALERPIVTRFLLAEEKRRRVRVLVVEDNPLDQLVVLSALRRVGYAPEAVTTGEAAVAANHAQPFDIVFMDVMMDGIDGCEAARAMRAAEEPGRRTPIIALTGRVRDEERERCREAGMDDFLPKPIDLELMCATVEKWVKSPAEIRAFAPAETPANAEPIVAIEPVTAIEPTAAIRPWVAPVESATPDVTAPPQSTDATAALMPVAETVWDEWTALGDEESVDQDTLIGESAEEVAPSEEVAPPSAEPIVDDLADLPVIDPERIESSSMGNPELRSMLVEAFLARTHQPLERLRLAYAANDARAVEIQAHSLKGLCGAVGASRAAALFDRIENAAGDGHLAAIEEWSKRAAVELQRAMEELEPRAEAA